MERNHPTPAPSARLRTDAPRDPVRQHRGRRRAVAGAVAVGLAVSVLTLPGTQAAGRTSGKVAMRQAVPAPVKIGGGPNFTLLPKPLSTSQCLATYRIRCYTPSQFHTAYDLKALYERGIDGRGTTVVVPIPFGSPTIRHDLQVFDRQFGLPDPELRILRFGNIPPYDPTDFTRIEWAAGTSLVVQTVHAIAPRAKIVLAETAVSETEGVTGFPELLQAEESLMDAGIGDVVVQIESTGEATFPGADEGDYASLLGLRRTYQRAAERRVTVLSSTGNHGRAATWPATDPLVTAVGGSQLYLDDQGRSLHPVTTWNDGFGAGGGGLSAAFARPAYQTGVAGVVGAHRGVPDITMSGSVDGGGWVYTSFGGLGGSGWNIFNGTGQAVSMFGGIVALADQAAGHRLGLLNPALYRLGALSQHGNRRTGLVDITEGTTSSGANAGFPATPGYDLATGWGTVDAARFVPALARVRVPHAVATRP